MLATMFGLLAGLFGLLRAALRSRSDLVLENLLLRHQLATLTRPTRKRPPFRRRDKLVWVLARRFCPDWRRHLIMVDPQAQAAIASFGEAQKLTELSKANRVKAH